jgi:nicotinamide-nucleotide amidase
MIDAQLDAVAEQVAAALIARHETVAVAEGSCGGLISASLLAVPGASAYFVGGAVVYTRQASRAFMADAGVDHPPNMRGATEDFARYLARSARVRLDTTWGVGEGGAAGPSGNPYGDPPGHAWVAVAGPADDARRIATGSADRPGNMVSFATSALTLLLEHLDPPG